MILKMPHYCKQLFVLTILTCSGCTNQPLVWTTIQASQHANTDQLHQSKPIDLVLYELTAPAQFKDSTFASLTNTPSHALGTTLVDYHEYIIRPGETEHIHFNTAPSTHYIGIIGGFHHLSESKWQQVLALNSQYRRFQLDIHIGVNRLDCTIHRYYL